jgi:hypothetical protein
MKLKPSRHSLTFSTLGLKLVVYTTDELKPLLWKRVFSVAGKSKNFKAAARKS